MEMLKGRSSAGRGSEKSQRYGGGMTKAAVMISGQIIDEASSLGPAAGGIPASTGRAVVSCGRAQGPSLRRGGRVLCVKTESRSNDSATVQ